MLSILHGGSLPKSVWVPRTLREILTRAADVNAGGIVFQDSVMTYGELHDAAQRVGQDMRPGDLIVLPLTDPRGFLSTLWACFLRGAVPVIVPQDTGRFSPPSVGGDIALLMRTSGSTGEPKLVPLTETNIIASVAASAFVNGYHSDDVSLNWLPLCHIGGLMRSIREVYLGCTQVQVSTELVRKDPLRWLDLIDEHRVTLTWGPNAAFAAVVAQRQELSSRRRWSLDSLRSLYSSGELAVPRTMNAFVEMLAPYGLRADSLRVAWGMTEACFATSSASLDDAGKPVPGVSIRIVGDSGEILRQGETGHLQIAGPLVAAEGWFDTGDLGVMESERLVITGRSKDVIRIGAVAYASRAIEEIVETIDGVSLVAACGVTDADGEALAIFADLSESLLPELRARVAGRYGIAPRFVIPLAPGLFPRTDVGKINRRTLREAFAAGAFDGYRRWPFDLRAVQPSVGAVTNQERERAGQIAAIVSDVLRVPVGIDDDFFRLGGTSLRVAQAASRIGCGLVDLFCASTPLSLAVRLARPVKSSPSPRARQTHEDVAIVGAACRFPGAPNVDAFWRFLTEGRDALTEFSEAELLASGIHRRTLDDPAYVRAGMIIDDIESFDADFFGLSARDAETMDPQQRVLLECAWHAVEDAGRMPSVGTDRVGVWVGARVSEYLLFHLPPPDLFGNEELPAEGLRRLVLNDKDYLATRLAHILDCRGPAVSVQTACSSSLVAVHMAARSLQNGECDMALAGGVSLRVPQKAGYLFTEGMIFSPDGRTRPFDAAASGTTFSSGVGVVALRRLADALRDGDRIYAVICGSAINNDGAGPKPAFTAPGHGGQVRVIADALADAEVDSSTVSYVEAHGTGTAVGDPIEIAALTEAFRGAPIQSCAIGSVKSNIGHLVQAAGVAGLIKTALMLRHRTLTPTANFRNANPLIDFASSPFFVNTELRAWENDGTPLRAGVSAFGFGGTNAHVILEEPPATEPKDAESARPRILPLSAKSPAALRELATAYAGVDAPLRDLCASAQNGRAHFPHRIAIISSSRQEMREKLASQTIGDFAATSRPRIAFVFTGQGSQYAGMGRQMFESHPTFRRVIDEHSLQNVLFHPDVERTEFAQPALVALQAALVHVWREWGVDADVLLGHSLGEITAAWAGGAISLEDALRFAAARGRLMERAERGLMAMIFAPAQVLESRGYDVQIAAINDPQQTVVSGSPVAVNAVLEDLRRRGIATRLMPGRHAFHSVLMEPILDELEMEAARMSVSAPQRPIISTLTGDAAGAGFARPEYWRRQARDTVQFVRALETARADVVVQIGPGHDTSERMLSALATLYTQGLDVNWPAVETEPWQRVALPGYPFQRKRYWVTARRREHAPSPDSHPLLGRRIPSPLAEVQFQSELTADLAPFARDHWIFGVRPLVMVGQLEMMRAATGAPGVLVENVIVEQPLLLSEEPRQVQTLLAPDGAVRIFSSEDGNSWELHSTAHVQKISLPARHVDLDAIRGRCREELSRGAMYEGKRNKGADIGPGIELVQRIWRGDGEVLAEVALDDEASEFASPYGAYPGLLDSVAQCGDLTLEGDDPEHAKFLFLPTVVERVTFFDSLPNRVWTTLRRRTDARGDVYGIDGEIADHDGRVLVAVEGFYFKRATAAALTRSELTWEVEWVPLEESSTRPEVEEGHRLIAGSDVSAGELCGEALGVVQTMLDENRNGPLWIVTRGAQATGLETAPLTPEQASLWGFGRAVQREQPQLRCRLVDLDPAQGAGDEEDLHRAMAGAESEGEVVVRGGLLYGKRLRRMRPPARIDGAYALRAGTDRTLEGLTITPFVRRDPGAGELEIEVYATGLNFRDVLNATGRIEGPLGYECSGVVTRCGAGVTQFEPGAAVMALAMDSVASHVTIDARQAVAKPHNLTFAAAASSVVAYLTAMYALLGKARLQAGERVLVHTAAGGVGHAAVHVARAAGAEVVGTASRAKRSLVRAMGVDTVVDSRKLGFSSEIEPVDVVLNTLGNEFTPDNVRVLRPGGRLVELGHPEVLDLRTTAELSAAANVELINFHIAQDVDHDELQTMLKTLASWLASGRVPALPYRSFAITDARKAFETILRGAHIGKLALVHPAASQSEFKLDPNATYLITGGSGAIGTHLTEWLVARGARHLALLSRTSAASSSNDRTEVRTFHADVADPGALRAALAEMEATMPPLRGVIHAAGVLDDGVIPQQNRARLAAVLAPKVAGAWNLHQLTESMPLEFFVLISSVAGLWGNAGQTSYAAGNAYLDQLAHYRRQRGLVATSVDYGAWRGAGMAATLPGSARRRRADSGITELEPGLAIRALESALSRDQTHVAMFSGASPLLAKSIPAASQPQRDSTAPRSLDDVVERTRRQVAELCGSPGIDLQRPLSELGLDSLSVLLLRGQLIAEFGDAAALPVIRFLEGHSIAELAAMIYERVPSVMTRPRWTSLTPIKARGAGPPIILVPPAARTTLMFSRMAEAIDGDHPVYGLNPLGLDGISDPHDRVQTMVEHYVREIRSVWPDGPYILGGSCFGGVVALEIARQLTGEGAEVPLLFLIDTAAPELAVRSHREVSMDAVYGSIQTVRRWAGVFIQHLRERNIHRWLAARLRDEPFGVEEQLHLAVRAHANAVKQHRAAVFHGNVLLLQSTQYRWYGKRWRRLVRGRLETVLFPGTTHADLVGQLYSVKVAGVVTERLAAFSR